MCSYDVPLRLIQRAGVLVRDWHRQACEENLTSSAMRPILGMRLLTLSIVCLLMIAIMPSTNPFTLPCRLPRPRQHSESSSLSAIPSLPSLPSLQEIQYSIPPLPYLSLPSSLLPLHSTEALEQAFGSFSSSLPSSLSNLPAPGLVWQALEDTALAGHHLPPAAALASVLLALVVSAVATPISYPLDDPYGPAEKYSPELAAQYYAKRPGIVLQRCLQLAFSGTPLGVSLLIDKYITKKVEDTATKKIRAKSLLEFVERNGCTYIKIGQAAR